MSSDSSSDGYNVKSPAKRGSERDTGQEGRRRSDKKRARFGTGTGLLGGSQTIGDQNSGPIMAGVSINQPAASGGQDLGVAMQQYIASQQQGQATTDVPQPIFPTSDSLFWPASNNAATLAQLCSFPSLANLGSTQVTPFETQTTVGQDSVAAQSLQRTDAENPSPPPVQNPTASVQANTILGAPLLYLPGFSVQSLLSPTTLAHQQQQQLAALALLQQLAGLNTYPLAAQNLQQNLRNQFLINNNILQAGSHVPTSYQPLAVTLQDDTPLARTTSTTASIPQQPERQKIPILLHLDCDSNVLSEYQCLVRKQIELFAASVDDISSNAQGRNKAIKYKQVGIRCRHCAIIPPKFRMRAAVYYPSKLDGIYQAAQNIASTHLCEQCEQIPEGVRKELLLRSKDRKSTAGGGKKYWADGARALGVVEDGDNGLRFEEL